MFPGIADRMGKEVTALAPSSMKIKGERSGQFCRAKPAPWCVWPSGCPAGCQEGRDTAALGGSKPF